LIASYTVYEPGAINLYDYNIAWHIVDIKRQNRLKVGTDTPKLKVKMQSAGLSHENVRKRYVEKPRFELAVKDHVFRLERYRL